jgi:hypothetical protein
MEKTSQFFHHSMTKDSSIVHLEIGIMHSIVVDTFSKTTVLDFATKFQVRQTFFLSKLTNPNLQTQFPHPQFPQPFQHFHQLFNRFNIDPNFFNL